MFTVLRSNNYQLAKRYADVLKDSLEQVKIEAFNDPESDEVYYSVLVLENDRAKALIIVDRLNKELVKDLKILQPHARNDDWENNEITSNADNYDETNNSSKSLSSFIRNMGVLTSIVFFACIVLYIFQILGLSQDLLAFCMMEGFSISDATTWYKLITPALMHGGIMHIAFNLVMWIYVGSRIEKHLSTFHLFLVFVLGCIIPNFLQYVTVGPYFIGLSGVVYALIGFAWIVSQKNNLQYRALTLPSGIMTISIFWILLGFMIPSMHMANAAHLGGLVVGLVLGVYELKFIKVAKN